MAARSQNGEHTSADTQWAGRVGWPPSHPRLCECTYRLFAEYEVEDPTGQPDGYIRIRLDQTTDDQITGYNRPEHLRAFPEADPIFIAIQRPLRAAAESANRTIDDHLPRERLHHFGFATNHLSMLAWQTHRNAQTEAIFTSRHTPTAADPPLTRAS